MQLSQYKNRYDYIENSAKGLITSSHVSKHVIALLPKTTYNLKNHIQNNTVFHEGKSLKDRLGYKEQRQKLQKTFGLWIRSIWRRNRAKFIMMTGPCISTYCLFYGRSARTSIATQ
jgi:hypothetical protein